MSFKDILVHLDASPRSATRLAVAADLAARFGAHLTGLAVVDMPPADVFYGFPSAFMDVQRAEEVIERLRDARLAEAATIETAFRETLRRNNLAGEWRLIEGIVDEVVTLHTRYSDLVVIAQPDPDDRTGRGATLSARTLMTSGRPMLIIPFAGEFEQVGRHILVGWDGSGEAARALNDSIPLLQQAKKVTVLAINPRPGIGGDGDVPAADIARHLARHDVKAEAAHTVATGISEGDALLSYVADIGADMLVCGLYGHSPLRERAFGGVTRSLLTEMTVPVLMAH
jgi:nucleotide-binding universal stress UspA family protein